MDISIKEIQQLTKGLSVLYVEDEDTIRSQMLAILELFFNNIYVATNGEEGLVLAKDLDFDLVISDIQMPKLDGLAMVETIRKNNPEIPVVITTAFNDQEYFLRSIDLKIDKYLIKPIRQENAKDVFYSIGKLIDDRRKVSELEQRKIQDKINQASEHIMSQITDSYQSPCIVYTNGEVRYINDAFTTLFSAEKLEKFLKNEFVFDDHVDFMHLLSDYSEEDRTKNIVSISFDKGRKIYRVLRKSIAIDHDSTLSEIYIFNDITLEEYQKVKIRTYTEMLEEFIFKTRYRAKRDRLTTPAEPSSVNKETSPTPESADEGQKLNINNAENELLRRSHKFKTTAAEYVQELDSEILLELQDLDELDREFSDSISLLGIDVDINGIKLMSAQLEQYANKISLLFEFEDLAYAIRSLATLLTSIDESQLDEKMMKKILIFLEGIQYDLASWRQVMFIEQSTLDIHYLDSSFYSACLQIELVLSQEIKEMESEEDDLILF